MLSPAVTGEISVPGTKSPRVRSVRPRRVRDTAQELRLVPEEKLGSGPRSSCPPRCGALGKLLALSVRFPLCRMEMLTVPSHWGVGTRSGLFRFGD